MVSKKRLLGAVVALFVVASLVHYVMFGSLPLGKPQIVEDDAETPEADAA